MYSIAKKLLKYDELGYPIMLTLDLVLVSVTEHIDGVAKTQFVGDNFFSFAV